MEHIKRLRLISASLVAVSLLSAAVARAQSSQTASYLTLQADVQETNPETEVVTVRGNVLFQYPLHQLEGTSEEAEYYVAEQRIVLMGNAQVTQQGEVLQDSQIVCLLESGQCSAAVEKENLVKRK